MNFQSFYILIFKKSLNSKIFSISIVLTVLSFMIISCVLKNLDFIITSNDLIKHYQINKINFDTFSNVDTIFVGDSSGGNAIDSIYFDEISGLKSINLCLTGSWGLVGSLGIIKKSLEKYHGKRKDAAEELGISERTLYRKIKQYNL